MRFWFLYLNILVSQASQVGQVQVSGALQVTAEVSGEARPVQIVRPDKNGGLEVVEEGLRFLENLPGVYDVVGVLGTFHTGKSFLLNQLMGRMGGFEIGPTVTPTTEGLWIWGNPLSDGSGLQVLLLDTEGLAAPGNTADYDAKIFAVATLLSTHIVYNSVKIVDLQSLDYLQVLARRAQLFALKSLLVDSSSPIESMIRFPPLTWVVEDFFQDLVNGETPTQWLQRLMREQESAHTGTTAFGPGLRSIFPEAHCHTVFLPATTKEGLQNLDRMESANLSPQYKEDIKALGSHLISSLRSQHTKRSEKQCLPTGSPSEDKEGQCALPVRSVRSGVALAGMVRVLVKAANQGTMTKMPDLWNLFLKDQVVEAKESAMTVFFKTAATLEKGGPPVTVPEYTEQLSVAKERALGVFRQALFGLQNTFVTTMEERLQTELKTAAKAEQDKHVTKIRSFITHLVAKETEHFEKSLKALTLPMPTADLDLQMNQFREQTFVETLTMLTKYEDQEETKRVNSAVNALLIKKRELNQDAQRDTMERAQSAAKSEYDTQLRKSVVPASPLEPRALHTLHEAAKTDALRVWTSRTETLSKEPLHRQFAGSLNNELAGALFQKYEALNEHHVKDMCTRLVEKSEKNLRTRAAGLELPVQDELLKKTGKELKDDAEKNFEAAMLKFSGSQVYATCLKQLRDVIATELDSLAHENARKTRQRVQKPLETARKIVAAKSDVYWLKWSWESMAREEAEKEIGNSISGELKKLVITQWLHDSTDKGVAEFTPRNLFMWLLSFIFH